MSDTVWKEPEPRKNGLEKFVTELPDGSAIDHWGVPIQRDGEPDNDDYAENLLADDRPWSDYIAEARARIAASEPGRMPACGFCGFIHDPDDVDGCGF